MAVRCVGVQKYKTHSLLASGSKTLKPYYRANSSQTRSRRVRRGNKSAIPCWRETSSSWRHISRPQKKVSTEPSLMQRESNSLVGPRGRIENFSEFGRFQEPRYRLDIRRYDSLFQLRWTWHETCPRPCRIEKEVIPGPRVRLPLCWLGEWQASVGRQLWNCRVPGRRRGYTRNNTGWADLCRAEPCLAKLHEAEHVRRIRKEELPPAPVHSQST
jgi:hypothetical protein